MYTLRLHGELVSASLAIDCCSYCVEAAAGLNPEEIPALLKLEEIKPSFKVWSSGRREDSDNMRCKGVTVPQPALIFLGLALYIGDMDDAASVHHFGDLGIGCVINLCADRINSKYAHVPSQLGRAGIHQQILIAHDHRNCDIISVAKHTIGSIDETLHATHNSGVLVHCWGGVKRSAAVAAFFLVSRCRVPLIAAVDQLMQRRGTVLTNRSFRKQLVQYCFQEGFSFEGSGVPPEVLFEAPCEEVSIPDACPDVSGRRHRGEGTKDSHFYGFLFAARDGCLQCVKNYIEQDGVDPNSKSDKRKYTALSWAQWELRHNRQIDKRKRYEVIIQYLRNFVDSNNGRRRNEVDSAELEVLQCAIGRPIKRWRSILPAFYSVSRGMLMQGEAPRQTAQVARSPL